MCRCSAVCCTDAYGKVFDRGAVICHVSNGSRPRASQNHPGLPKQAGSRVLAASILCRARESARSSGLLRTAVSQAIRRFQVRESAQNPERKALKDVPMANHPPWLVHRSPLAVEIVSCMHHECCVLGATTAQFLPWQWADHGPRAFSSLSLAFSCQFGSVWIASFCNGECRCV